MSRLHDRPVPTWSAGMVFLALGASLVTLAPAIADSAAPARYVLVFKATEPCDVEIGGQKAGRLEAGVAQPLPVPKRGGYQVKARSVVDGIEWKRRVGVDKPGEIAVDIDFEAARAVHYGGLLAGAAAEPRNMEGGVKPPRIIEKTKVKPKYPRHGFAMRKDATVLLSARIERDGSVTSVEVLKAPDEMGFAEEPIKAVRQWRYEPATHQGEPVPVFIAVSVSFTFDDDPPLPTLEDSPRTPR